MRQLGCLVVVAALVNIGRGDEPHEPAKLTFRLPTLGPPTTTPRGPAPAVFPSGEDRPAQPELWACPLCCVNDPLGLENLIPARGTVRHDFGDGVGYDRGFTYLEGFLPLYQPDETSLLFSDFRVVNFDDASRWEFNVGAGYRTYFDLLDTVLGVNLFYDGRHTDTNFFHQIGVGGEAIFNWWELRCNGYFIVGDHRKIVWDTGPLIGSIIGNQVVINRAQRFDVAMGGLDVEVGGRLPVLMEFSPRVYLGYYHYSAEGIQSANGIRGRFEAWLTPHISLHFSVQNDAVFDTTINGGLAFHLGGTHLRHDTDIRSVEERLGQRVVRDVNLVIAEQLTFEQEAFAIFDDPAPLGESVPPGGSQPPTSPIRCFPGWQPAPCPCPPPNDHRYPPGFHRNRHGLCFYWPRGWKPPKILRWHKHHHHHRHDCDDD